MMPSIWTEGDETHVALSPEETKEIAEALMRATAEYPDSEFEIRFTEEDGGIRWFVKAKPPMSEHT